MNAYIAVIAMKDASRVQDLLAYASLIVKASNDYEGTPWLLYDSHFRSHAAAKPVGGWCVVYPHLWTQYFNQAQAKCNSPAKSENGTGKILGTEQRESTGQQNPSKNPSSIQGASRVPNQRFQPYPKNPPICRRWNSTGCREASCSFRYICIECHGNHREVHCPLTRGRQTREQAAQPRSGNLTRAVLQLEQHTAEETRTLEKNIFCVNKDPHLSTHNQPFTIHTNQAYTESAASPTKSLT